MTIPYYAGKTERAHWIRTKATEILTGWAVRAPEVRMGEVDKDNALEIAGQLFDLLRRRLELAFRPDTAAPGCEGGRTASSGHCAAVAIIVERMLGGTLISASVDGLSHWFNRIELGGAALDVDLTGDQFGHPGVRTGPVGTLFSDSVVRSFGEVKLETLRRARLLASRAHLDEIERSLRTEIAAKGIGSGPESNPVKAEVPDAH